MKRNNALGLILLLALLSGSTYCTLSENKLNDQDRKAAEFRMKYFKDSYSYLSDTLMLIKDESTAVAVAEPILFSIYGKSHVEKEKPYRVYLIDNKWYIAGRGPELNEKGGTFEIIIDAKNCKVLFLAHGK